MKKKEKFLSFRRAYTMISKLLYLLNTGLICYRNPLFENYLIVLCNIYTLYTSYL